MILIKTHILNPLNRFETEFRKNVFLTIKGNRIHSLSDQPDDDHWEDYTHCVCLPGMIDAHVHLSQFRIRGKHSSELLPWLNEHVFPEEARSSEPEYADVIAREFFQDLIRKGTTTSVIYTAPFFSACDKAFRIAEELGVRALIGAALMDVNSPEGLQQKTDTAFQESVDLYHEWNGKNELLEYIFSPRFAPVCSPRLMKLTGDFAARNNAYIQTHLSENLEEIKLVRSLYPEVSSYTEVYLKNNLLGPKTLLGHAIHLSDSELEIIKKTGSKVIHCPDSNFFLKSGQFPWSDLLRFEIPFALGSDVGAGTDLSMFQVMKMANYRQDEYIVSPEEAFYLATRGGAEAIGKDDQIGAIEVGKSADLVFADCRDPQTRESSDILSELMYLETNQKINTVFVNGKIKFQRAR